MEAKVGGVDTAREIILVKSGGEAAMPQWRRAFAELVPDFDVRWWDDTSVDPDAVRYVLVWQPEPGRIAAYLWCEHAYGRSGIRARLALDPNAECLIDAGYLPRDCWLLGATRCVFRLLVLSMSTLISRQAE